MKTIIKTLVIAAVMVLGVAVLVPSGNALAQAGEGEGGSSENQGGAANTIQDAVNDIGGDTETRTVTGIVKVIINVLLYFIGALSVIMIIFGGFKYVTSAGDSNGVSSAKSTIMYAVIGLIVSVLAFTLVNFVLDTFKPDDDTSDAGRNAGSTLRDRTRDIRD